MRSTLINPYNLNQGEKDEPQRGSIFLDFMKNLKNLGPAKWNISNVNEEKNEYEIESVNMESTLHSFDYRNSRGF